MFGISLSGQPGKGANNQQQGDARIKSPLSEIKPSDISINTSTTSPILLGPNEFSFLPAIFVPFNGIRADDPRPKDRDGRLKRILEYLDTHQDAVRQNMFELVRMQRDKLVSEAREAMRIEEMDKRKSDIDYETRGNSSKEKQEIEDVLKSMRTPARKGANENEYDNKNEEFMPLKSGMGTAGVDAEGDTTMGGTGEDELQGSSINYRLCMALQDLTIRAAAEIEAYDKHAQSTKDYYQRALERHLARHGTGIESAPLPPGVRARSTASPISPATSGPMKGILRKTPHEEIRIDRDVWAAMNHGSPVTSPLQMENSADAWGADPSRSAAGNPLRNARKGSGDRPYVARKVSFEQSVYSDRR